MELCTTDIPARVRAGTHATHRWDDRWKAFAGLAAHVAFEAAADGVLTFVAAGDATGEVLGRPAAELVGQDLRVLLVDGDAALPATLRQHPVWMRHADGGLRRLLLTTEPLLDGPGGMAGLRGIGVDVTEREGAASAALRRAAMLDRIMAVLRQEALASRMMGAVLGELVRALDADGAAIVDLNAGPDGPQVLHGTGADAGALLPLAAGLVQEEVPDAALPGTAAGQQVLACPAGTRFGDRAAVLAWRAVDAPAWDADDQAMAVSVTGLVRMVLEHEAIQRELARQARTDPLTGLLNRRAFLEEAARRIDRLDREGLPGTLVFIDLDRLKPLNDRLGHEAGDAALMLAAGLLRRTFRPSDLVARLGGDEFALWLDGSDEMTAAERADRLRTSFPAAVAHMALGAPYGCAAAPTLSIGIACRPAGSAQELETLIERADLAMYEVKQRGGGGWRVSQACAGPWSA